MDFFPAISHYISITCKPFVLGKEDNLLQNCCKVINQYKSSLLETEITQTRALLFWNGNHTELLFWYVWRSLFFTGKNIKKNCMKINFCQFANKPGNYEMQNAKVNFCVTSKGLAVCLVVLFFFNVLTRHTNLFGECAARCVHLSLQEEECTYSSWGDSKMYTSAGIANSQRMLTQIDENGTIAKISNWVESNTVKHLKAFRIIYSECKFHLS